MRMLLLAAFSRFFVMGVTLVGLLFIIRAVLVAIGICMIPVRRDCQICFDWGNYGLYIRCYDVRPSGWTDGIFLKF